MTGSQTMKLFDVQGIELHAASDAVFAYVADPAHLPAWTSAFATVANGKALMRTPQGQVEIDLVVLSSKAQGTIDWKMTFPDGSMATAFSRVISLGHDRSIYTFLLTPPSVPLEQLEGTLDAQSRTLADELLRLKGILENHD